MRKLVTVLVCLLYVVWPLDLLPDFVIGLGQVDDLVAILIAARSLFGKD